MTKKFYVALILFLTLFGFVHVYSTYKDYKEANAEIEAINKDIASVKEEISQLQTNLDSVNDVNYIEQIAREQLGFVLPNEIVFRETDETE